MEIFQIAAIGMIGALLAVTVKKQHPEFAAAIGIVCGIVILFSVIGSLGNILSEFNSIISQCGIAPEYFQVTVKLTGIAYITKFAAEICRDCGENAIAAKIEFGGKVSVLVLTIPIISDFLSLIIETLSAF